MTFGSLFAGIGGFDLGFTWAGMTCSWQVEIDPYCRQVLAKHWPDARRHDDVRTFPHGEAKDWQVDVICGGFPCQDISNAGLRAGIEGERSGLWAEYARIVRFLRPRFVVVENVPALLVRGIDRVLGDLAQSGYDAEWDCLPAAAFGAHHIRDRVFIVAHARGSGLSIPQQEVFQGSWWGEEGGTAPECRGWSPQPAVGRVAYGVPSRVDRLKGLGNAVVPQVAEWIGRRLMTINSPKSGSDHG